MIKVDLVCDATSPSGYSAHARELIKAMHPVCDLRVVDHKHDSVTVQLAADEAKLISTLAAKDRKPEVRIQFETPEFFRPEPGIKNIGFTQWETTRIPDTDAIPGVTKSEPRFNWVKQMNRMDAMWSSCDLALQAFRDSGVTVPTHVVRGPVDCELYQTRTEEMPLEELVIIDDKPVPRNQRPFVVGTIAQWTPRKGLDDLLVCVLSRFRREELVLLLKVYGADFSDREQAACIEEVKRIRKMVRNANAPKVVLVTHKLTDTDVSRLYNSMDVYVNPSKGEGFCMPLVQAMASSVVPISNGFSAPSDYIAHKENGFLVKYTLEPAVYQPFSPWYRYDQDWGRIDVRDLEEQIRAAMRIRTSNPLRWDTLKTNARAMIVDTMSHGVVGQRIKTLLERTLGSNK